MIHIEPSLYLRIQPFPGRPHPRPLDNGCSEDVAYRALGIHSRSHIVASDRDETYLISNRHFRVVGTYPAERRDLRSSLASLSALAPAGSR